MYMVLRCMVSHIDEVSLTLHELCRAAPNAASLWLYALSVRLSLMPFRPPSFPSLDQKLETESLEPGTEPLVLPLSQN